MTSFVTTGERGDRVHCSVRAVLCECLWPDVFLPPCGGASPCLWSVTVVGCDSDSLSGKKTTPMAPTDTFGLGHGSGAGRSLEPGKQLLGPQRAREGWGELCVLCCVRRGRARSRWGGAAPSAAWASPSLLVASRPPQPFLRILWASVPGRPQRPFPGRLSPAWLGWATGCLVLILCLDKSAAASGFPTVPLKPSNDLLPLLAHWATGVLLGHGGLTGPRGGGVGSDFSFP